MRVKAKFLLMLLLTLACPNFSAFSVENPFSPLTQTENKTRTTSGKDLQLHFVNADLKEVISYIAERSNLNVIFGEDVKGKVSVIFKKPVDWKTALTAVLERAGYEWEKKGDFVFIKKKKEEKRNCKVLSFPVENPDVEKIKEVIKETFGDKVEVVSAEGFERIFVRVCEEELEKEVLKVLGDLSSKPLQVEIRARIVQIESSAEKNLGINWNFKGGRASVSFNPESFPTFTFGILDKAQTAIFEANLKALEVEGKLKVLSSPHVITLNGKEAVIEQGIEIPYKEVSITNAGATTYNLKFKKASLILKVKPVVLPDRKIMMEVEVRKDSPNYEYISATGGKEPAINTRNVRSVVVVRGGETLVIGGIKETEEGEVKRKVPVISEVPLFGKVFVSKDVKKTNKNLLIMITPVLREL